MHRSVASRVCLALALTLTLTFGCAAAANAQPLDRSVTVIDLSARLLKAASSWMGGLFTFDDGVQPAAGSQKRAAGSFGDGDTENSSTMTGTCIDPWGNRIPCPPRGGNPPV